MTPAVSLTAASAPAPTRTRRFALLGISLGYFMVLLDMTVLSVAEPDLARSLGSSMAGLQWAVAGYTVVFGALLLSAGAVADRIGAHRAFRAGIVTFGVCSLLSAFAPNLWTLVGLRALLGAAAAACVPASMAMISRLYPEPAPRARALAAWAATSGAALAAGPVIGGLLVDLAGWRAIFVVNVPLAVVTLALTAGHGVRVPRGDRVIDWPAQVAACVTLGLLTDALIALGSGSMAHAAGATAAALAAGVAFGWLERRATAPVLVPEVLRVRGMAAVLGAGAAVNFTMAAALFVLPLLFQQTLRLTPMETGVAFLPMTLPFAFNPLLTGRLVARAGPRWPILAGLALLAVGGLVFAGAILSGGSYPALVGGLVCTGFGVSLALPALVTAVVTSAPPGGAGAAGGLLNAVRQIGATVGVAAVGAFAVLGKVDGSGTAYALLVCAGVCVAAAVVVGRARVDQR
ncbi:MFS transporter [Actinopolymorpha pittospori]